MREYDERRMDKLERWLMARRNPAFDQPVKSAQQNKANSSKGTQWSANKRGGGEYKDRGRQPVKVVI